MLVPIARALGAQPESALVEVYAQETVKNRPSVRILEVGTLPGAKWTSGEMGPGTLLSGRKGRQGARIAWMPLPQGGFAVLCARSTTVDPTRIAQALESLPAPPCGAAQYTVSLSSQLAHRLTRQEVLNALGRSGAQPKGVLQGPLGIYALAYLPGALPSTRVGGISMNLALRVTYDSANRAKVTVATPTLPGGSP